MAWRSEGEFSVGFREIADALLRRWYVVIAGIIIAAAGGLYVFNTNPPAYTARSLVLLLPPTGTGEEVVGANPFLSLGGLELTARVVVATFSSTSFANEVEAISEDAEVGVAVDDSTRGGVIAIDVKDSSESGALFMLDHVTDSVSARLDQLQQEVGVESYAQIRSMLLAKDTEGEPDYQALIRLLVIVVGGVLAVTVAAAILLDVLVGRGRRRRAAFAPTGPLPAPGVAADEAREQPAGEHELDVPRPQPARRTHRTP